jgi:catalase (peroxidase I)
MKPFFIGIIEHHLPSAGIVVLATLVLGIILSPSLKLKKLRQYRKCHHDLTQIIIKNDCNPILLRLAWSDAASYDHSIRHWPDCGGVNGSIHYDYELAHPSNAGLSKAIEILKPLKKKYHYVSWADLIQMGGVLAVELAGGPRLSDKMLYGRIDAPRRQFRTQTTSKQNLTQLAPNQDKLMKKNMSTDKLSALNSSNGHTNQLNIKLGSPGYEMNNELEASRLPVALPPYPDGAINAEVHIRNHFYRMGLNHRETVVLIGGGHTLGRAFANRSGVCKNVTGDIGATSYTKPTSIAKVKSQFISVVAPTCIHVQSIPLLMTIFRCMCVVIVCLLV